MDRESLSAALFGLTVATVFCLFLTMRAPSLGGFAIVEWDSSIVVADSDVVSYSASRQELTLTSACASKLEARSMPEGAFTIIINGNIALSGIFVPSIISRSYPSNVVVITYPSFDFKYGTMKIQMGYPWALPGTPGVEDSALVAYFSSTGRLSS